MSDRKDEVKGVDLSDADGQSQKGAGKRSDLRAPVIAVALDGTACIFYGAGVLCSHNAVFATLLFYLFAIILPVAGVVGGIVGLCTLRPLKKPAVLLCIAAIAMPVILLIVAIVLSNNGVGLIVLM